MGGQGVPYIRVVDNLSVGSREDLKRACIFDEMDPSSLAAASSFLPATGASLQSPDFSRVHLLEYF